MKRREFIVLPALMSLNAQVRLRFFTAAEAKIVDAACARIIPADESGPGAREAGAVIYIDRQLAGPYGKDKYRYTKAPWIESVLEHGYQGKATPREIYRTGIATLGAGFAELPAEEQDKKLESIEKTMFFEMLRTHTIEGMFCDPMHGGNIGMVGWKLTGYPGPLMTHRDDLEKYRGVEYPRRAPKSLEQLAGRKVTPWEDELD